jgi:hypothetical protein
MRLFAVLASLSLVACNGTYVNPPPAGRFYFPTGLLHFAAPGSDAGVLVVASSNFDKRFGRGALTAVSLDGVGLPPFGAMPDGGAVGLTDLGQPATVLIHSFAGELAALDLGDGRQRLYTPSRSEGMNLQAVDLTVDGGVSFTCFPAAPDGAPQDCATNAPSLSPQALESTTDGVPRASQPFGVSVRPRSCSVDADCGTADRRRCQAGTCLTGSEILGDVFVTHLNQVDSPLGSQTNYRGYLVHLESDSMSIDATNFLNMGTGGSNSAAAGARWTYVTGRYYNPRSNLLRLVDRQGNVITTAFESLYAVSEGHGVALSTGEDRLYLVGRGPDVLLVVNLANASTLWPTMSLARAVALPAAPEEVVVIPRPGRGDLVALSCAGSSTGQVQGLVALYDEDVGDLVAQVPVGIQPFGLAIARVGAGARIFASNFGDGRVSVIDVPDLIRPQDARLVAYLGASQLCLTQPARTAGCQVSP